jgi:RNA recognition motif-containing protein
LDDDEDDDLMERLTVKSIQPTAAWRMPALLPNQPDITRPELVSQEKLLQDDRMRTIPAVRYTSEMEVSSSPDPLTDIEQALDMTSQSSVALTAIPFFVPQQPAVPDPSVEQATLMGAAIPHAHVPQQPPVHTPYSSTFLGQPGATPEFLQSLGLPLYLVGQDTQALQTVANSPGLLSTLVDATGQYDQQRLLSLVQTLSASGPGRSSGQQQMQTPAYLPPQPVSNMYGQSPAAASLSYGGVPAYSAPVSGGFRSNSDAGNLHISGFGPGTTQTDIIQLFSPYVRVDEVFMKGSFAFVNTSDPVNAQIAREALSGTLLCGAPVRINPAQRKTPRESSQSAYGPASHMGPPPAIPAPHAAPSFTNQRVPNPQAPMIPSAIPTQSVDDVRDDRGNPATKNLFVAGYGPTTTEEELRAMFSQQAEVIGVVLKGAFSFVNTLSREQAVACRQVFGGTMLNGGVLRINFAKETGRLGTSFDLTYGKETGPNARRPRPPGGHGGAPPPPSAYGGPPNMYGPPSGYGGGGGPSYYGP